MPIICPSLSTDPQELARRFNEDEAVWRSYQQKRKLRKAINRKLGKRSRLPKNILDELDWRAAELECRPIRAIGLESSTLDMLTTRGL